MSFARLQRAPEGLFLGEADVTQRQADLADRVISREAIVVKHLQVQRPTHQFVVRKACNDNNNDNTITTIGQRLWPCVPSVVNLSFIYRCHGCMYRVESSTHVACGRRDANGQAITTTIVFIACVWRRRIDGDLISALICGCEIENDNLHILAALWRMTLTERKKEISVRIAKHYGAWKVTEEQISPPTELSVLKTKACLAAWCRYVKHGWRQ